MMGAPMMGGYGMGYGSPLGFGGGLTTGQFLGIELINSIFREQARQAQIQRELKVQQQLGQDQAKIAELQMQLTQQNSKIDGLKSQAPPGTNFDQESLKK